MHSTVFCFYLKLFRNYSLSRDNAMDLLMSLSNWIMQIVFPNILSDF